MSHAESFRMVLEAIVDNAIRFSPPGSEITVDTKESSGSVVISIEDRGPGIEANLLDNIWDGFRVGDLAHHSAGQGIGLALAHGIMTALGGTIEIHSGAGQGTRVVITLPEVTCLPA
jgi:signal transduction histidine kinase